MIKLYSKSVDETKAFGKKLAPYLKKGDVIVLSGDLGAGKTMFVSGLLGYYGKENEASSPTFTIINEHQLTKDLKLFHFDVYRFDFEDEFLAIGGEEFYDQGICLIEWGEKIKNFLPKNYIQLSITKDSNDINTRIITLTPIGEKYINTLSEVFKDENTCP